MPRNRSARVAALGSPIRRPVTPSYSSRQTGPLRRRIVVGALLLASLVMITLYVRQPSGGLHDFQSAGASVMRPFEIAAQRVARPFSDAYHWTADLFHAKSENERLRDELERTRAQLILSAEATRQLHELQQLLRFRQGKRFPQDFPRERTVAATVLSSPASDFEQKIIIAAGSKDGISLHDAVVTGKGLVGHVSKVSRDQSRITLLTDQESAVSARDVKTGAVGVLRHGEGSALFLDRVPKDKAVRRTDVVVTAGRRQGPLGSFFPKGIPIGVVTSVGQTDVDLFQDVQVQPFADFSNVDSVLVLLSGKP